MFTETGMVGSLAHPHFFLLFVLLASAAAISDLRERRIPNDLVAAIFFLALLRHLDQGGLAGLVPSPGHAISFVLIAGALLFLFARDMLGGGDVKMLAASALYIGSENQGVFFLLVALFGGLLEPHGQRSRDQHQNQRRGETDREPTRAAPPRRLRRSALASLGQLGVCLCEAGLDELLLDPGCSGVRLPDPLGGGLQPRAAVELVSGPAVPVAVRERLVMVRHPVEPPVERPHDALVAADLGEPLFPAVEEPGDHAWASAASAASAS